MKKIIVLVFAFILFFEINLSVQTIEKIPEGMSASRHFVLENRLNCIWLHIVYFG
jgi:hypothetical protein